MAAAPSPERQRLAEAIAEHAELERTRQQLNAAGPGFGAAGPGFGASRDADAAIDAARKQLDEAVKAGVDHRIAVLAGSDEGPPPSQEDARRRLRMAEDDAAAVEEARREVRRRLQEAEGRLPIMTEKVRSCANAVAWAECKPTVEALLADFEAAKQRVAELRRFIDAFAWLAPPLNVGDPLARRVHFAGNDEPVHPAKVPSEAEAAWRAAFDALLRDATAKLPGRA